MVWNLLLAQESNFCDSLGKTKVIFACGENYTLLQIILTAEPFTWDILRQVYLHQCYSVEFTQILGWNLNLDPSFLRTPMCLKLDLREMSVNAKLSRFDKFGYKFN